MIGNVQIVWWPRFDGGGVRWERDKDVFLKTMNKYGNKEDNRNPFGNTDNGVNVTSGWTEIDLSDVMKRPCYAYKRGNIVFTTIPPPRDDKRARSASSTSSSTVDNKCSINVVDANCNKVSSSSSDPRTRTDFCEVCCGIRSPSFSRRAHSFTTHFCTRVPAKRNVSTLSPVVQEGSSSDCIAPSTVASSLASSYRNPLKVSFGSIYRDFVNTRGACYNLHS